MDILGFGGWEIFIIILVALFVFGPGRMVEFARTLGKIVYSLKHASTAITTQISKELDEEKKAQTAEVKNDKA